MMPDTTFGERTEVIMANAIPDLPRLKSLWNNARACKDIDGAFAELGVYKGGSALLMYEAAEHKRAMHLFDTFTGIPSDDPFKDGHRMGEFGDTSVEYVREIVFNDANNVLVHKGVFPFSTENLNGMRYAMVHIDADLYDSTYAGISYFWPRLMRGGRLVFDDYGWLRCPGVKLAIDSYKAEHGVTSEAAYFVQEASFQITMIKL
jgi:O-methyltransferase